jgi:hypothetical protein
MTTSQKRLDKIRSARSIPDLTKIVGSIKTSLSSDIKNVSKLLRLTNCKIISMSAKDDEITIDHTGTKKKKVKVGAPTNTQVSTVLKGFKSPKATDVKEHGTTISSLYEKAQDLESIEAVLMQSFAGTRGQPAALKAVRELKKTIDASLQKSFASLGKISNTHLPKELRALADSLTAYLIDNLGKDSYKNISEKNLVFRTKDNKWQYTVYIRLDDLKNDSDYVFDDYNVVLSAIIDKGNSVEYFLNTLVNFKLPGKFPLGKKISNAKELRDILAIMLRHNDVISTLDKKAMPLSNSKLPQYNFTKIPGVKDVKVDEDELILILASKAPKPAEINKILTVVLPLLNNILGNKRKQSTILKKVVPKKTGSELRFMLAGATKESGANLKLEKIVELQHALDLTDTEVKALKQILVQDA